MLGKIATIDLCHRKSNQGKSGRTSGTVDAPILPDPENAANTVFRNVDIATNP
jgi:hypothetical protein